MRFLRTLVLFCICLGLLALAGYWLPPNDLALPAALAGVSCFAIALA